MPRLNISPPKSILYQTGLSVQIGDLNYGNHLSNDAVLRMVHEARIRWLAEHGYSEFDIGGCGLIMTGAAIQYRAQAMHGDQLQIGLGTAEISAGGFRCDASLLRLRDQTLIATVQCHLAAFDYTAQRVRRLPEKFSAILNGKA